MMMFSSAGESEGVIDLGAVGMYYRERGTGRPLILVHAGIADGRMWAPQFERLSARFRVVVPDLRGFGRTPMAEASFSYAEDLVRLCAALDIDTAAFVGASMGGTAVIDLALGKPDLVACLVSIGGDPSGYEMTDPETIAGWVAARGAFERGDHTETARIESEMWFVGQGRARADADPDSLRLVVEMLLRSYQNPNGQEVDPPRLAIDNLGAISQESLLLVGEFDRSDMVSATAMMADQIPSASVFHIPDTGHLPSLESPDDVTQLIEDFLSSAY